MARGSDEENTAFGLPENIVDHRPGFHREVAPEEAEKGKNIRRRPSDEKDVPREPLAVRIRRRRKEDHHHG